MKKLTVEVFKDAPSWANYAAVDASGEVWFYEYLPEMKRKAYSPNCLGDLGF